MSHASKIRVCLSLSVVLLAGACAAEKRSTMDRIRINKQVVVGTDAVNIPFEFGKGMGVQGLDVDIADEIAKDLGYEVRWIKIPFERLLTGLQNGDFDFVISAITITDDRKNTFAFSQPYFTSGQIIAIRRETTNVKRLSDLSGLRVGVQEGTTGDTFLSRQTQLRNVQKKGYNTLDDALLALNTRELDAVVGDQPILSYSIYTSFPQLKTLDEKLTTEEYGVVLRKEDTVLLQSVNKTLQRLKGGPRYQEIYAAWFGDVERGIAEQRRKEEEQERLRTTLRSIEFRWVKDPSFNFRMSRLDGFNITLRHTETGATTNSTPIETQGNNGVCRIRVLPGTYRLTVKGYPIDTEFDVPVSESMNLTSTINLGNQISIGPPK